jgi:hypothetical protein
LGPIRLGRMDGPIPRPVSVQWSVERECGCVGG